MYAVQTMRIIVLGLLNFVLLHFLWSCFHLKKGRKGASKAGVLMLCRWQHSTF